MILDRYLARQIAKPFLVVCLVLIATFAGYCAAVYLGKAAGGALSIETVASLIALKVAIALEVLLPLALFLTVVVGLGRMYENNETTALRACGVSPLRIVRTVLWVILPVALCVGVISLFLRPWAYTQSYWLRARDEDQVDPTQLEGGHFHHGTREDWVLFAERTDGEGGMEGIFLAIGEDGKRRIVSAGTGRLLRGEGDAGLLAILHDVHAYDLVGSRLLETHHGTLKVRFAERDRAPAPYKRKAAPTRYLARSDLPTDQAEFQWRLSRPLSTLLLGLLAVFLSHSNPGRGGYAKVFPALGAYLVHICLSLVAKSWVGWGTVGAIPGLWWVDALLGAVVVGLLLRSASVRIPKPGGGG